VNNGAILLVEDNPDDVALTLRAFKKNRILNEIIVARDGVEALDYLFGAGAFAGRDTSILPAIVLLDLKLPRLDGHEVRVACGVIRTRLPASWFYVPKEDQIAQSIARGEQLHCKPVDFDSFMSAVGQSACTGCC
jgi:two-component system response regulator